MINMSTDKNKPNATLGIDKRRAEGEADTSKEYKKPKKSLKQLTLKTEEVSELPVPVRKPQSKQEPIEKVICREDIIRVTDMLERVIVQQGRAQECIDNLLRLCLQEGPEESSGEEVRLSKVR